MIEPRTANHLLLNCTKCMANTYLPLAGRSVSYPVDTWGSVPGNKGLRREADHLPPSSAEVKNGGAITSFP
jgi:hypothetical protein